VTGNKIFVVLFHHFIGIKCDEHE